MFSKDEPFLSINPASTEMKRTKVRGRWSLHAPLSAVIPVEQQRPPNERAGVIFPIMNSAILLLDLLDNLNISSQRSVWKSKLMSGNTVILGDTSFKGNQNYSFAPWITVNCSKNFKKILVELEGSEYSEWPF